MNRSARILLLVLAGIAGCAVVVLGALASLVVALATATLAGLRSTATRIRHDDVVMARAPVAEHQLAT